MRYTPIIILLMFITSCTSLKPKTFRQLPQPALRSGLPAQTLASGECGLFLWTKANPRDFIFFHKIKQKNALLYINEQQHILLALSDISKWTDVLDIDWSYEYGNHETARIKGVFSDDIEGGQRVDQATITITMQEGWQEIIPVSGVYACR